MTNPSIATVNQSVNNYKTIEDLRCKVLNDNTTASVINQKPKTVELRSSKLSERLKITSPPILPPSINNYNNDRVSTPAPSIFHIPQVRIIV